ncbi:hypothetical protein [Bradyrhizobium sp. AUGA SZCCT0431]|uniref:hypothetical protein n=1 Tax=Bradyrhizobium sp. AUGA SZCCT0431 TaxID=2807674 RepID=UPI001BAB7439|nr:hypothetical protein [Bradyrhizobium sp. AUGA SZCCT0431]MBR1143627.1 hypothetical protein [Bradyrhizobium sp. AUGA SZCCT0431]
MNYKTLVAASLMSIALTSAAFAQCTDCAMYPDRDVLNKGAPTPASKMMAEPGGAAGAGAANFENGAYNGRAGARVAGTQRRHYHDANASMAGGSVPADTPSHRVYLKNLHDSGYNPGSDVDGAGNMKVN